MAFTTINKSTDYFSTNLYTGTGSALTITTGHQSDFIWIKQRTTVRPHSLFDSVNSSNFAGGNSKYLVSNTYDPLTSDNSTQITANSSTGFSIGTDNSDQINNNGDTAVAWSWKANGQGSANTDGTINTLYTSASATSGFSISTYTGTGSAGTIGHGLGVAPTAIWIKKTSATENWFCWNKGLTPAGGFLKLDRGGAASTNNTAFPWNPQANTFGVSTDGATNANGSTYVAYCFADVQGFSKMGSYTGNGNANGIFQYLGFKPAYVLIKNTQANETWMLYDDKRGYNGSMAVLSPDETAAEISANNIDLLSNGFKIRTSASTLNTNAQLFIYMAFAEEPLVSTNGNAATAR